MVLPIGQTPKPVFGSGLKPGQRPAAPGFPQPSQVAPRAGVWPGMQTQAFGGGQAAPWPDMQATTFPTGAIPPITAGAPQQQASQQQFPGQQQQQPITSGINPPPVYQPYQTQGAINQAMGLAQQQALTPSFGGTPGLGGSSPGLQFGNAMDSAAALAGGYQQAEGIRLGDRAANLQQSLGGRVGAIQDMLSQATNQFNRAGTQQRYGNQMGELLMSAIMSRIGGVGNMLGQQQGDRGFWANIGLQGQQAQRQNLLGQYGVLNQIMGLGGGF